uniref:NADH-ubiquinone oxidoreductase chain 2 n=1 Tax=Bullacta caurina TaxID=2510888 RepID=A0A4D6BJQ2_9GAST|nr:NADH dehydrogenase subunit 2 [Bullacta caurina]QBX88152.1 NADH dehydrogenase subunit 2 [Bullacta caurina]
MSSANVLFMFVLILGPLVAVSSSNWIVVWVGVELSFLGLIPLLFLGNKYMSLTEEATLKYFCIQALSSAIMFCCGMAYFMSLYYHYEFWFVLSLCLKLGIFPGHFWVPSVVSSLEFLPTVLLLSWQKVPPLALLMNVIGSNDYNTNKCILMLGGLSALVGGLIGNNVTNVRAMIGASSISHTGWAVIGATTGSLWIYFGPYCLVLALGMWFLWENDILSSISILSLSGLPPFILFVGKWKVISSALVEGDFMFLILPIVGTILSLVFYLKFFYSFYLNGDSSKPVGQALPLVLLNLAGLSYLVI